LRSSEGKSVGIATGGGPVQVAAIAEQVGRAPQQFDAGALLFFFEHTRHGIEILIRFG
jgi:hypothetical protein